jgi:hypothetical protein
MTNHKSVSYQIRMNRYKRVRSLSNLCAFCGFARGEAITRTWCHTYCTTKRKHARFQNNRYDFAFFTQVAYNIGCTMKITGCRKSGEKNYEIYSQSSSLDGTTVCSGVDSGCHHWAAKTCNPSANCTAIVDGISDDIRCCVVCLPFLGKKQEKVAF